eukprot:CAMPEP_0119136652 /NCGR_PEP_ID=MMETSP1310-20130426/21874_1 /TAXON_ID=464262 /ORGANISM="Genus nov. species nov., Strain RCC2339" /LENGTH=159 /DNA_ID=CAMNT_0007127665 /DNA_START=165 /DNA_END=644 /DNA_ORIENTATION=-
MANQQEKKIKASNAKTITYFAVAIVFSFLVYGVGRYLTDKDHTTLDMAGLGTTVVIELLFMLFLITSASGDALVDITKDGFHSYYCDMIMLATATLTLAAFSSYAWGIYLVIPGFLGYKIVTLILSWTRTQRSMQEGLESLQKRNGRKEKRAKVRTVRR